MSRQLEKLLEQQRKLAEEIAAAKKREAFGRRLLAIAKKAGADLIEDDAYWQTIFARAVEDYQKQVQVQQQVVPLVIETQEPEEEV